MASFVRNFKILCRTPLVRQPSLTPLTVELTSFPIRPTLSSGQSKRSFHQSFRAAYASDKGKMELYSDESGSTGAGIDDVAKSGAAFDTSKGPEEAAEAIEKEVGLDGMRSR
jgi:hypothetical protein